MEIVRLTESNYNKWNEFAMQSDTAWFRHTTDWLEYSSCCRFDSNTKNVSFFVMQSGKIQAIVPLLIEYSYPERIIDCFAMYGDYTPLPAYLNTSDVDKEKVKETINEEIKRIIAEHDVKYGKFVIDPLIENGYFLDFSVFNMLEESAKLSFTTTNIVDLRLDIDTILRKMRKGHKAAIKQVKQSSGYHVDIFDKENITKEKLLRFKKIHMTDAGRQTRTDKSWECMYHWIQMGRACLTMLWIDDLQEYCAAALVMMYKHSAYYASYGIIDSTLLNGHAGYIIQWETICYLKNHDIYRYETGENLFNHDDKKLYDISKYKRGFRTVEIPKITFLEEY